MIEGLTPKELIAASAGNFTAVSSKQADLLDPLEGAATEGRDSSDDTTQAVGEAREAAMCIDTAVVDLIDQLFDVYIGSYESLNRHKMDAYTSAIQELGLKDQQHTYAMLLIHTCIHTGKDGKCAACIAAKGAPPVTQEDADLATAIAASLEPAIGVQDSNCSTQGTFVTSDAVYLFAKIMGVRILVTAKTDKGSYTHNFGSDKSVYEFKLVYNGTADAGHFEFVSSDGKVKANPGRGNCLFYSMMQLMGEYRIKLPDIAERAATEPTDLKLARLAFPWDEMLDVNDQLDADRAAHNLRCWFTNHVNRQTIMYMEELKWYNNNRPTASDCIVDINNRLAMLNNIYNCYPG